MHGISLNRTFSPISYHSPFIGLVEITVETKYVHIEGKNRNNNYAKTIENTDNYP